MSWLFSAFVTAAAHAEPFVDLAGRSIEAYGGPYFRVTRVDGDWGIGGGGPLGVLVFDRRFGLGLVWTGTEGDLAGRWMTYGGLRGEYVLLPGGTLGLTSGLLAGGGGLVPTGPEATGAGFLVVEPDLSLTVRFSRSTRVAWSAGYREVPWSAADGVELGGPFVGVSLQYGVFGEPDDRGDRPDVQLSGGYTGRFTTFGGEPTWLDGGGTRLLIGRSFGLGATGFVTRRDFPLDGHAISGRYAGVEAVWAFASEGPVHPVVGAIAGMGGAGYPDGGSEKATVAAIIEPEAFVEADLATFLRLALGASYRGAVPIGGDAGLSAGDLGGPAGIAQLRFGWF